MSSCHKQNTDVIIMGICNPMSLALIFQTMNSVRSNSLNLKGQKFTAYGCKDVEIRKFEFVVRTQFSSYIRSKFQL